ncbi:CDP-alcohol phosphatidyltransferase family protein [Streptomyces coryli]|uniref:CDP-alcohol phosphatidyltransferase family protein n=1 Tax=Streptomyces coryli TaxID=1128680 RepID=UPI001F11469A|nr:CDP-alcohol phosphatidyltransferase family protein [Streptomyces coryli]
MIGSKRDRTSSPAAEPGPGDDDLPPGTRLTIADLLTLANATCGFLAVYFTTTGVLMPHLSEAANEDGMARQSAATAVMLILLAAVFDLFDGLVARRLRSSAMGAELDNLSDLISFGLAPAYFVLVYGLVTEGANPGVAVVAAVLVMLAVVLRLARFSATTVPEGVFQGMPSPFGALTVVSIVLLRLPFIPTLLAVTGAAWLMVSRVEYPKPRGRLAAITLIWVCVSMGCLMAWAFNAPGGAALLRTGCALQIAGAVAIPLAATVRRLRRRGTPA